MRRALIVAALAASLAGTEARGYVRSTTDKGTPIYWPGSCVWLVPDSAGTADLPFSTVLAVIGQSINNWQSVTYAAGCSYMKIILDPPMPEEVKLDHVNVIKFITGSAFCRPADGSSPEMCYSSSAAAITTVFYDSNPGQSNDGQIVDADIQLNDVNFTFVIEPSAAHPRSGTMVADLENTLTHELGHFQGLDHTCWDHTSGRMVNGMLEPPLDGNGQPIPDCNELSTLPLAEQTQIKTATMYNFAQPGEITKRMPKPDDIAGICAIYPKANDPMCCQRPSQGSCSSGGGCSVGEGGLGRRAAAPVGLALVLLGALALVRARRR